MTLIDLHRWAVRVRLSRTLVWLLAGAGSISGIGTYVVMSRSAEADPLLILVLLNVDLIFLVFLVGILARNAVKLWVRRRRGQPGARLHVQVVAIFSLIAAAPAIVVALFAAVFFTVGIEGWFSERVSSALTRSLAVAEAYVEENRKLILADVLWIADSLERSPAASSANAEALGAILDRLAAGRGVSEAVLLRTDGQLLARSSLSFLLSFDRLPSNVLARARRGETVVFESSQDDRVRALSPLSGFAGRLLYIGRYVDPEVSAHIAGVRSAVGAYQRMESQREGTQITFTMVFIVVAVLLLMVAVWLGFQFASRLVGPISELSEAADKVREGNLAARVNERDYDGEIGGLFRAFNRMTGQLSGQHRELVEANTELDARRRFTEAVLGGVSAGVLGVDPQGSIFLSNLSASRLLGISIENLNGRPFEEEVPAMAELFSRARIHPEQMSQDQVTITREGRTRHLLVRVNPATRDGAQGYVVTFDDMTERVLAQRAAAWGDVARRIAHEIRNPLTPIRLAAERIKKRYAGEIQTEPDVFSSCIDTIVLQVGEMRRMVDEFSEFGRMPSPEFAEADIGKLVSGLQAMHATANATVQVRCQIPTHPVRGLCDERQIAQALTNLVNNAVHAAESRSGGTDAPPGVVSITLEEEKVSDGYRIVVDDNGGGFSEDVLDRATEPYVTTRRGGTGLGLAIVRRIVEDQGGSIALANTEVGARVTLTFPRARPAVSDSTHESEVAA